MISTITNVAYKILGKFMQGKGLPISGFSTPVAAVISVVSDAIVRAVIIRLGLGAVQRIDSHQQKHESRNSWARRVQAAE